MERSAGAFERKNVALSFEKAGIGFKVLGGPLPQARTRWRGLGGEPEFGAIFQMDICETERCGEYIRLWPGAADNEVEVRGLEPSIRQLVLRVREPKRRFFQSVPRRRRSDAAMEETIRASGGRVVERGRLDFLVEMWTPSEDRYYLCGKDDIRLFITEIEPAASVPEAHEKLKPNLVREAERSARVVLRQGEWFFIPPSTQELGIVEECLASHPHAVRHSAPLGQRGTPRPHIAEEVIKIARRGWRTGEVVFARGTVRHAEHRPLTLPGLCRAVLNRAVIRKEAALRLRWVD